MSNGCKVSPRSLHADLAGHLRVNRTEIRISSRFAEREGKLLVRIERFGLKHSVTADDRMWNIVAIGPRHAGSHRHRESRRAEAEVIDLHLRCCRLLLRACQKIFLTCCDHSRSDFHSPPTTSHIPTPPPP